MSIHQEDVFDRSFQTKLNEIDTTFNLTINKNNFFTVLTFPHNKMSYTINLIIDNKHLSQLLRSYLENNPHDHQFGTLDDNDNLTTTHPQKIDFCFKIIRDSIQCLDNLFISQKNHLLDYAVYFYRHQKILNYKNLIQNQICDFIIREKIILNEKFPIMDW